MNNNNDNPDSTSHPLLAIAGADVLRLVAAHLGASGLHETARTLQAESGVGIKAPLHQAWLDWAIQGKWSLILQSLSTLDVSSSSSSRQTKARDDLCAQVHEHVILEAAAAGDLAVAHALYRLVQATLQESEVYDPQTQGTMSRARRLELQLAALGQVSSSSCSSSTDTPLPKDYYPAAATRDERRRALGEQLVAMLPVQPPDRLLTLLQQAVKYQSLTGALPRVREIWHANDHEAEDGSDAAPQKKKKKHRHVFDLVLGKCEAAASSVVGDEATRRRRESSLTKPLATIKFGKRAVCEAAVFAPNGASLVTGSSDGLVEVWSTVDYSLRTDLPYQASEEAASLGHTDAVTALALSPDGTLLASGSATGEIRVWRLDSGKALRTMTHSTSGAAVSHLVFCPDGSRLLSCGGRECREFGLRTASRLRDYTAGSGDTTVRTCGYYLPPNSSSVQVWTAAADGCLRFYQAATASFLVAWRPTTAIGSSLVTDASAVDGISDSPALHSVLVVHTTSPPCFLLVPRSTKAYLVNADGILLRVFTQRGEPSVFCAAALSPGQQWLYAVREDGVACVFDVASGELERTIDRWGSETTAKAKEGGSIEVSTLVPHPHKTIMACFSNDKRQKKGQLVVWK